MKTNMISLAQRSLRACGSLSSRHTSRHIANKLPIALNRASEGVAAPSALGQRFFSSQHPLPPDDPQAQFQAKPPVELNMEMAQGIQTANHLILKHGVGRQRLELLAKETDSTMPLVLKWQRMMEIYLGAQLHVVASLGYQTDEQGIMMYTQQLAQFVGTKCDPATQDEFRAKGRDTWREMLTIAFDLDKDLIAEKYGNELSIVDARNIVHKVASALIEPNILEEVATRVSNPFCFLDCMKEIVCEFNVCGAIHHDAISSNEQKTNNKLCLRMTTTTSNAMSIGGSTSTAIQSPDGNGIETFHHPRCRRQQSVSGRGYAVDGRARLWFRPKGLRAHAIRHGLSRERPFVHAIH